MQNAASSPAYCVQILLLSYRFLCLRHLLIQSRSQVPHRHHRIRNLRQRGRLVPVLVLEQGMVSSITDYKGNKAVCKDRERQEGNTH
jgi:hypothetical protein